MTSPDPSSPGTARESLLRRLDRLLMDGPGGEAEGVLVYAANELFSLSPDDPAPNYLIAFAEALAEERREITEAGWLR